MCNYIHVCCSLSSCARQRMNLEVQAGMFVIMQIPLYTRVSERYTTNSCTHTHAYTHACTSHSHTYTSHSHTYTSHSHTYTSHSHTYTNTDRSMHHPYSSVRMSYRGWFVQWLNCNRTRTQFDTCVKQVLLSLPFPVALQANTTTLLGFLPTNWNSSQWPPVQFPILQLYELKAS